MKKLDFPWVSSAAGAISFQIPRYAGHLHRVVLKHPAGGAQPVSYMISISDENGVQLVAARPVTDMTRPDDFCPLNPDGVPYSIDENLLVTITAAGNAKAGTVSVYIQE